MDAKYLLKTVAFERSSGITWSFSISGGMDRSELQPKICLDNFQNVLTSKLSLLRLLIIFCSYLLIAFLFAIFASRRAILKFNLSAID